MLKPAFIDLSHHNVVPQSFAAAKASGIQGVIHKLTEGSSYLDDKVDNRFYMAQQAGMLWGLYHFVRPGNMRTQAEYFLSKSMQVADAKTLYCLDWEDTGVDLHDAIEFLQLVEAVTGHAPVLYSGHVLKEALNGKPNAEINKYRLWLAQYASAPTLPPGWNKFWGWQYTDDGRCPGINPPVDLNAYDGTAEELAKDWSGRRQPPKPEPVDKMVTITMDIVVPPGIKVNVKINGEEPIEIT